MATDESPAHVGSTRRSDLARLEPAPVGGQAQAGWTSGLLRLVRRIARRGLGWRRGARRAGRMRAAGRRTTALFIALDHVVDFLAVDLEFLGRLNSQFHRLAFDAQNLYDDAPIDDDAFVQFT